MAEMKKVLFVCLGNTCRSPIAEAVFLHIIKERGIAEQFEVDSAAVANWHVGSYPNPRARSILNKHNVSYNSITRQICPEDFKKFDFIFGMDQFNIADLTDIAKSVSNSKAKILLLGDFDPQGERIIRDPYCICPEDFNKYDVIFGMDERNIADLTDKSKSVENPKAKILLLGDFDPEGERIIRDPYFQKSYKAFEDCFQHCTRCCNAYLDKLN